MALTDKTPACFPTIQVNANRPRALGQPSATVVQPE
jgi:hypothetical protein